MVVTLALGSGVVLTVAYTVATMWLWRKRWTRAVLFFAFFVSLVLATKLLTPLAAGAS